MPGDEVCPIRLYHWRLYQLEQQVLASGTFQFEPGHLQQLGIHVTSKFRTRCFKPDLVTYDHPGPPWDEDDGVRYIDNAMFLLLYLQYYAAYCTGLDTDGREIAKKPEYSGWKTDQ